MKTNNDISLYASYAKDTIMDRNGRIFCIQRGGPARYLVEVFSEEALRFSILKRKNLSVDIQLTNRGEFGRVQTKPKPKAIPWNMIRTPNVCISTIVDEYTLADPSTYTGKIFLDIQGYVRDGTDFGKKQLWKPTCFYNFFCIKCTKQEKRYIPTAFLKKQKQRMLLVTDGSNGSTLYWKNKKIVAQPKPILNLIDTIGAGDTLFGYFISALIRTNQPEMALRYATTKTSNFLQVRTRSNTCELIDSRTRNLIR